MSEPLESAPAPPAFADHVVAALTAKNFKPKCSSCSAIGWANFAIFPRPVYQPIVMSDQGLPAALLICQKCGEMSTKHLAVIGITLTMEQRQVLTAAEIAAQQKPGLIVQP